VAAVALAVLAAHRLGLRDSWWAAISAFMVMQASFGPSLYRGLLRVLGTIAGAALGCLVGPLVVGHPALFVVIATVFAGAGLYAALAYRHAYAWILAAVTFVMVMCDALTEAQPLQDFAVERVLNVALGAASCLVMSALHALVTRSSGWMVAVPEAAWTDRREALRHALCGAVAVALLAMFATIYPSAPLVQAMVTTIAVLLVAPGAAGVARHAARQRMIQRLLGCLLAGALALVLLPLIERQAVLCQIVLAAGVWIGAYLQHGAAGPRYLATQFSVAFIMVFVQDQGWTAQLDPALHRLAGVFAGTLVLYLIVRAADRLADRKAV